MFMHQRVSVDKVYSPHYLKRISACFWEPVKCLGGQPFSFTLGNAARLSRWIVVYPPFGVSSSASLHGWRVCEPLV